MQNDSPQHGLGAVILQENKPIAFASRTLTETERQYAQIEKELLSVIFAMEKFDQYVYGRHVVIQNDHKPLQTIAKKPLLMTRKHLQKMLVQLHRYTFELTYRPGSKVEITDALSRATCTVSTSEFEQEIETVCSVDSKVTDPVIQEVAGETGDDKTLQVLKHYILNGWPNESHQVLPEITPYFALRDGMVTDKEVIYKGNRCVIQHSMR